MWIVPLIFSGPPIESEDIVNRLSFGFAFRLIARISSGAGFLNGLHRDEPPLALFCEILMFTSCFYAVLPLNRLERIPATRF